MYQAAIDILAMRLAIFPLFEIRLTETATVTSCQPVILLDRFRREESLNLTALPSALDSGLLVVQ